MKTNFGKRFLAFVLCGAMMLGSITTSYAEDTNSEENAYDATVSTGDAEETADSTDTEKSIWELLGTTEEEAEEQGIDALYLEEIGLTREFIESENVTWEELLEVLDEMNAEVDLMGYEDETLEEGNVSLLDENAGAYASVISANAYSSTAYANQSYKGKYLLNVKIYTQAEDGTKTLAAGSNDSGSSVPCYAFTDANQTFTISQVSGYEITNIQVVTTTTTDNWNHSDETRVSYFPTDESATFSTDGETYQITLTSNGTAQTNSVSDRIKARRDNPNRNSTYAYTTLEITVSEVQETTRNFTVNLYKYNVANVYGTGTNDINAYSRYLASSDSSKYMLFTKPDKAGSNTKWAFNQDTKDGAYRGLVKSTLGSDGLPVFTNTVAQLFDQVTTDTYTSGTDTESNYTIKDYYYNVQFPFEVTEDGYYVYDSTTTSATLDKTTGVITTGEANGGFWPFGKNSTKNSTKQYWFGMDFSTDFYMSSDGKDENGNAYVFEFSGDDDVWVFIDGKLVLDIGGIHPAVSATLNFATGEVTYTSKNSSSTSTLSASELQSLRSGKTHTLQVFYLERGAYDSNCKIKFNLPSKPQQNVLTVTNTVQQTVNGTTEDVDGEDSAFTYTLQKLNVTTGAYETVTGFDYTYYTTGEDGSTVVETLTSTDGQFTLLNDDEIQVELNGLGDGTYRVVETLRISDGYATTYTTSQSGSGSATTGDALAAAVTVTSATNGTTVNYQVDFVNTRTITSTTAVDTLKTAEVLSWDERTYTITLSADSKSTTTTSQITSSTDVYDVVFVIDRSLSMDALDSGDSSMVAVDKDDCTTYVSGNSGELQRYYIYQDGRWQELYCIVETGYGWNKTETRTFYDVADLTAKDSDKGTAANAITHANVTVSYVKQHCGEVAINSGTTIYTAKDRLDYVQEALTDMTSAIAAANAANQVAIVSFSSAINYSKLSTSAASIDCALTNAATGSEAIQAAINALESGGGTEMAAGLSQAYSILNTDTVKNNGHKKLVIFFSDGDSTDEDLDTVKAQADAIRVLSDVTIYTVGYYGTGVTETKSIMNYIASGDENNKMNSLLASSANGIKNVFSQVVSSVLTTTVKTDTEHVTVVDYIDDRFDLVEVPDGAEKVTYTDANGVTHIGVQWDDQTISCTGTWTKTIKIKAKDSYIGGNDIPTNIADHSGIIIGDGELDPFDQTPTVNVKVTAKAKDITEEIFLGETLEQYFTDDVAKSVFDVTGKNDQDVTITYQWYTDEACTEEISEENIRAAAPTDTVTYYAKISITPKTNGSSSASNMTNPNGGYYSVKADDFKDLTGTYTVTVVSGSITVTKTINASEIDWSDGNPIFTLSITGNGVTQSRAVEFTKEYVEETTDENGNVSLSVTFTNLAQGKYTVSEDTTLRYKLGSMSLSGDSKNNTAANVVDTDNDGTVDTFYIGLTSKGESKKGDGHLNSRDGIAEIANVKKSDDYDSDNDIVRNHFIIKDGKIVISQEKVETGETNTDAAAEE